MRFILLSTIAALSVSPAIFAAEDIDFVHTIQPIFAAKCVRCHGEDQQEGNLRLDRKADAQRGGDSGKLLDGNTSLLLKRITAPAGERMPPEGEPLSPTQIEAIRLWIAAGAIWPEGVGNVGYASRYDWWSFQPLRKPAIPIAGSAWPRTPIDHFILQKLVEHAFAPSSEADRRTLFRRVSFDLVGLPPDPDDVEAFVADSDPLAYEKLVDRLLASPQYGERWARHWLDVVHYGDTHGYDKDKPRPNAWPYRDYVIRSLNADKPYARFVQEQLAGDVLWPDTEDGITATGFIAAGPWDFIGHAELPETKSDGQIARLLDRDDMVTNTFNTFCSLTVQCARCHNHKFDPVTQTDYYRLQANFAALDRADRTYDVDPGLADRRAKWLTEQQELNQKKALIERQIADEIEQEPPERISQNVRSETRQELAEIDAKLAKLKESLAQLPPPRTVFAGMVHTGSGNFAGTGASGGKPRTIHVLYRGDLRSPGEEVGPGVVPLSPEENGKLTLPAEQTEGDRRVALAQWIMQADHPLTWRSIVNRLWQYHFGRGLVDSPNDFGHMGQLPSHPELLDWLAVEFRDHHGSWKHLHRLIVTSAVYRQSSSSNPEFAAKDSQNEFLWRMNRRRLEAEAVRDSVLQLAGKLDDRLGGPAFQDFIVIKPEHSPHYEYGLYDPENPATHRRSVYRFLVRSQPQPFMTTLDCADPSMQVDKRNETVTALQALALLNNKLMVSMSQHAAERMRTQQGNSRNSMRELFRLALSRPPTAEELADLTAYADEHGLENACRVLFNLNEFVFVD